MTGRPLDLLTDLLRSFKEILLRNGGRATDDDLLDIERKFRQEYAGCRVYVGARRATCERYSSIVSDVEAGMGYSAVAQRHNCSLKTVRRAVDTLGLGLSGKSQQTATVNTQEDQKCQSKTFLAASRPPSEA